ncbi:MAG: DNA gyrase subunit A, partial [Leptospiraceae bacterium]|nr:DNA gyrase subunit A [Leptospiraceae bacterium]
SKNGLALRTNLSKLRSQGRTATGVTGMRLAENDILVGVTIVDEKSDLLVITENGYGKRMDYSEFSAKGRGGKGMTYLKITDKNGPAVGVVSVSQEDEVIIIAVSGMVIRVNASEISKVGRATVGVKVVNIKEDDKAQDFAIISEREDE